MTLKNKRVIITGGFGVIGRELIELLIDGGAHVQCFDRVPWPKDLIHLKNVISYHFGNIDEQNYKAAVSFDPHFVFHLAASFERSEESKEFWETNYRDNVQLSHVVLEASREMGQLQKFIFASSYLIYDKNQYTFRNSSTRPVFLKEGIHRVNPRNICGAAKFYTENELDFLEKHNHDLVFVSARIYRVYGKGSRDIISRWVKACLRGDKLEVFGRGNSFDYIFASDVAEGLLRLALSEKAKDVINLGSGKSTTINMLLTEIGKIFPEVNIKEISPNKDFYERSVADITLLKELTDWQPHITLRQGLKQIVDYERGIFKKTKNEY